MDLEDLEVVSTRSEDQYSFRTESDSQSGRFTVKKEEDEIQFALPSFSNKNQENENIFETKTETLLQVLLPHAENLKHDNLKQKEEETCLFNMPFEEAQSSGKLPREPKSVNTSFEEPMLAQSEDMEMIASAYFDQVDDMDDPTQLIRDSFTSLFFEYGYKNYDENLLLL